MGKAVLDIRNVHKSFGSQQVLAGVNLVIEQGLITTIIGRSGVGKSVLLKHIAGLIPPDKGDILFNGRSLVRLKGPVRRVFKRHFGYMFQNNALFDSMTVFENIALPLQERTSLSQDEIRERVMNIVGQLDLQEVPHKYPSQISGGMCKRVALARALITEPEIILFDEPATGLDPIRKNAVYQMITRCQRDFGFTAMIVSHDIPDVFYISQKVAMLEKGKIIFEGTHEEIIRCEEPVVRHFIEGKETYED
ncbi:MAG TPA: ATP-binding cassette domain-containing protein [bacterium]|nr:ATP-binding cassette domain-containing protein [bacterium]